MIRDLRITPMLTFGRLRSRAGDAWLDIIAILSNMFSTAIAMTLCGGVFMFWRWNNHPSAELVRIDEMFDHIDLPGRYFPLALIAAALLVIPIFSLGASSAMLGASGRSQRLASLRLVGLTGGQATMLSLTETVVQWFIGGCLGIGLYLISLPMWAQLSFINTPIDPHNMLLEPWMIFVVLCSLLVISLLATAAGLRRVRISPLGVARRQTPKALRWWRIIALVVILLGTWIVSLFVKVSLTMNLSVMVTIVVLVILIMMAIGAAGSLFVQFFAQIGKGHLGTGNLLACARIQDDPKATWRSISSLSSLCFIAGVTVMAFSVVVGGRPNNASHGRDAQSNFLSEIISHDIPLGIMITLAIGFLIAAFSTLMNQASVVFERACETQALSYIGFPQHIFSRTRIIQVFVPLFISTVISACIGVLFACLMAKVEPAMADIGKLAVIIAVGLVLTLIALSLCTPLERRVVLRQERHND